MTLIWYEIKKVLLKPSCCIALLILAVLATQSCVQAISGNIGSGVHWSYEDGQTEEGYAAAQKLRAAQSKWSGTLNQQLLEKALAELKQIDSISEDDEARDKIIYAQRQELKVIRDLLNQSFKSNYQWEYQDYFLAETLDSKQLPYFYENRITQLRDWLYNEGSTGYSRFSEAEKQYLIECYKSLETPFQVDYSFGWDMSYEVSMSIALWGSILLAFLIAQIFAGEFRWKTDSIYFSTEHGRKRGSITKLLAGFLLTTIVYCVVMLIANLIVLDLKTGKWHCFSEDDGGNFVSFWSRLHGVDTKTAYKEILEKYHVSTEKPKPAPKEKAAPDLVPYSLDQYSFDTHLPKEWLEEKCHLSTARDRGGVTWLRIPYIALSGEESTYRKRYGNKDFRWRTGSSGKICLYGEWRIPEFSNAGYAVIVEGESDTQSLWYMGIPAIGVAGASMFKPEQAAVLDGLKLYIHHEPDKGGDTFIAKVSAGLKDGGFTGEAYTWECSSLGTKDPSDLYMKNGRENAAQMIRTALKDAKPLDYQRESVPEAISGAPIHLRQPEGWIYSDKGISRIDEKKYQPVLCCRTPIILTKRLQSIETGEEKIEVAFKRDGQWQKAIYPRSTVFQSRSITVMADLGCTITSENSKQVVRFLGSLEAENIDIIPKEDSTGTFGWQPGNRFIPGHGKGITLDIDPSQRAMATAYCQNGTFEKWIDHMAPHRGRNKFRFILAASFAAPLLRIVKQRIFFVYNWGGSKGGKTAALKAALSAWGDPERLMVNFNATQVGLERTAAFCCDLPLGIDERQLAGNNQGALEKIVYMIASGTGKIRGAKGGGLQATQQWRTVALATGEEPLSTETTQTGVSTRVLELYGGPFDNEKDAGLMHQQAAMDCGWAGPAFVEKIIATGEPAIIAAYERMQSYVHAISGGRNGSHISGIAAVALADAMIDSWFFGQLKSDTPLQPSGIEPGILEPLGISDTSWQRAKIMAAAILQEQVESNSTDVNENAAQFIVDWVLSNKSYFGTNVVGTCLGMTSESQNTVYIFPSMLNQALTKAGYSPRKTMKYLADHGLITATTDRSGKKVYSVIRRFGDRTCRFVEFFIGKLSEAKDPLDYDDDDMDETEPPPFEEPPAQQLGLGEFKEITDEDGDLPF